MKLEPLAIEVSSKRRILSRARSISFEARANFKTAGSETRSSPSEAATPESPRDRSSDLSRFAAAVFARFETSTVSGVAPVFGATSEESDPPMLHDLRGRPGESFPGSSAIASSLLKHPRREELLFLQGVAVDLGATDAEQTGDAAKNGVGENSDEDFAASRAPDTPSRPWSFSIRTCFDSFPSRTSIAFAAEEITGGVAPELGLVSVRDVASQLGDSQQIELTRFRLGLELYRSRFRGPLIGSAPGVEIAFYCEIARDAGFWLQVRDERVASGREVSPEVQELLAVLDAGVSVAGWGVEVSRGVLGVGR